MRINISKKLLVLLNEKKMDQADLVKLTSLHKSTISRLASGLQNASIDQIEEISDALGVHKEIFFKDEIKDTSQVSAAYSPDDIAHHQLLALIAAKDETIHALKMTIDALKKT